MSLRQAIKVVIIAVAVMCGASASAFAHAGHGDPHAPSHANVSSVGVTSARVAMAAAVMVNRPPAAAILGVVARPSSIRLVKPTSSGQSLLSTVFHGGGAFCPPGACCCKGASSCGMGGHYCASIPPDPANWNSDLSDHMRYHLARLGWVYPDVVIGLDRPPKA